jgi:hypothetical protein
MWLMADEKSERDAELEKARLRPANKSDWPPGVRTIALGEVDALGVDAKGELYWHGKPVEIRRPLDLSRTQLILAWVIAIATVVGAIGATAQGFAAYGDWACKVGWKFFICASPPATKEGDAMRRKGRAQPPELFPG